MSILENTLSRISSISEHFDCEESYSPIVEEFKGRTFDSLNTEEKKRLGNVLFSLSETAREWEGEGEKTEELDKLSFQIEHN